MIEEIEDGDGDHDDGDAQKQEKVPEYEIVHQVKQDVQSFAYSSHHGVAIPTRPQSILVKIKLPLMV